MKIVAYVIHLRRSVSRLDAVKDLQARCPVPISVQDAVDGSLLDEASVSKCYSRSLFSPEYPFRLRLAEIGIFLSHRSCWRRMVDEDVDAALILEDDAALATEFGESLSLAIQHVNELGVIQFLTRDIRGERRIVAQSTQISGPQILEHVIVPLKAIAQMVSRDAAGILLDATDKFDRPIDTLLQLRHITGQRVYSMHSTGVVDASSTFGGTTIHTGDKKTGFLERELKRFMYRSRVRRLSRRFWNSEILGSN